MKIIISIICLCVIPFLAFSQLQQTRVSEFKTITISQTGINNSSNIINISNSDKNKEVENEMINIPLDYDGEAGIFTMGSSSSAYQVTLTNHFDISKYLITNYEFCEMLNLSLSEDKISYLYNEEIETFVVKNTEGFNYELLHRFFFNDEADTQINYVTDHFEVEEGYEDYPIYYVTWAGAAFYCNYMSEKENKTKLYDLSTNPWTRTFYEEEGYRLPTSQEWEYAATYNDQREYAWGNEVPTTEHCNFSDNGLGHTTPVNQHPLGATKLGLYDICGNLHEMTNNYAVSYTEAQINPTGPETTENPFVATKGGNYNSTAGGLKVYWNGLFAQYNMDGENYVANGTETIGFRIAKIYSETPQTINNIDNKINSINNYPNPANSFTTFIFYVDNKSEGTIIIQNINGQVVDQINIETKNGKNVFLYNTKKLNNGIYFYTLKNKKSIISNKMIISH